jgi:3-methyladenine DNA glycosylase AlkD
MSKAGRLSGRTTQQEPRVMSNSLNKSTVKCLTSEVVHMRIEIIKSTSYKQPGSGKSVLSDSIRKKLQSMKNPAKAAHFNRFFKNIPGGYGEGDMFLGLTNPQVRSTVMEYVTPTLNDEITEAVRNLITDPYHEVRLTAVLILVHFARKKKITQKNLEEIYNIYTENKEYVNNWDLIDLSAEHITGAWMYDKDRSLLYEWIKSPSLWDRRIAILSGFYFIRKNDFKDVLSLCEKVLDDPEDLIHKASGWMLRETGKRNKSELIHFLEKHSPIMPRTMHRY